MKMNLYSGCIREYKWTVVAFTLTLVYLIGMDIALYYHIQDRTPSRVLTVVGNNKPSSDTIALSPLNNSGDESEGHSSASSITHKTIIISPFAHSDVKFIMLDHFNLYIATPTAAIFAKITHFHEFFFFITPNMISFTGVMMGFLSARLIASQDHFVNILGIVAQIFRNFFDALDGIIAKTKIGNPSPFGYYIDGIADTIGIALLLVGVFYHLQGSRKAAGYKSVHTNNNAAHKFDVENDPGLNGSSNNQYQIPSKRILYVVLCYAGVLAISGAFWNIFVVYYHNLLEEPPRTQEQADLQNAILQSSIMWLITLLWRLLNSFALTEWLLIAIYLKKPWEYLVWVQYLGFVTLLLLISFTTIFYHDISSFIQMTDRSITSGYF